MSDFVVITRTSPPYFLAGEDNEAIVFDSEEQAGEEAAENRYFLAVGWQIVELEGP